MDDLLKVRVICEDLGVGVCLDERVVESIELFLGEGLGSRSSDTQTTDACDG